MRKTIPHNFLGNIPNTLVVVALEEPEERAHKNAKELLTMNDKEFREWVIKGLKKRMQGK